VDPKIMTLFDQGRTKMETGELNFYCVTKSKKYGGEPNMGTVVER
jgi:hypothetical protein